MEADGLRWWLLITGSLVIVGLAVHGIWLSRKNSNNKENANQPKNDQGVQPSQRKSETDSFDEVANIDNVPVMDGCDIKLDMAINYGDEHQTSNLSNDMSATNNHLGLGQVRVVTGEQKVDAEAGQTLQPDFNADPSIQASKMYASVVTQPKPEYAAKQTSLAAQSEAMSKHQTNPSNHSLTSQKEVAQSLSASNQSYSSNERYQIPEPPPFLLKRGDSDLLNPENANVKADASSEINPPKVANQKEMDETLHTTSDKNLSLTEQERNLVKRKKTDPAKKRIEPNIGQDQSKSRIDSDDQPSAKLASKEVPKTKLVVSEPLQEVLVLNVKCADDNPIFGSALLPMLLTLGFKFGDQDIFHRHINSNGKGPVLFSLANMFKPGNFDIDNLENFTTQGISLFMILPIEGEPHQVFNMMHNAARKISDEFSAQIYDGKRSLLTKQSLQQYVEKIREFERQRLLKA
ncbi:MAG: cell division protein ZipA [Paraglaciecola sp.]|jgi:cell division protein ZipA